MRQAKSGVFGAREDLRNTEQNVLQNGAIAYMNVLRDTAVLDLRRNNITVLEEQLRQTRDRFNVGQVTRTGVAHANRALQFALGLFRAQANLQNSVANFRQIIGVDPTRLEPARTIEALLPKSLNSAVDLALGEHPAIQAAFHAVDAAELQVKLVEGELAPSLNVVGNVQRQTDYQGLRNATFLNGSVVGQISVPIYTGGEVYARVRPQAKETLSQARLQADLQRNSVRASVVSSWGALNSAKAVIQSAKAAVKAAEIALDGIREEAKVGQRTTFDVLFAGAEDAAQYAGEPRQRAARPRRRLLRGDGRDRKAVGGQSQPQCRRI